jgi:endonuclease YncB( thermonuclease family)
MKSHGDKMPMRNLVLAIATLPILSGCVVGTIATTAVDVVTLPVKVASAGVDAVTTSQSEADEKRGRELRKQEEERGKQARQMAERCRKGRPLPTDNCSLQPN